MSSVLKIGKPDNTIQSGCTRLIYNQENFINNMIRYKYVSKRVQIQSCTCPEWWVGFVESVTHTKLQRCMDSFSYIIKRMILLHSECCMDVKSKIMHAFLITYRGLHAKSTRVH